VKSRSGSAHGSPRWKLYEELRPLAGLAFNADDGTQFFGQVADDGQSEPLSITVLHGRVDVQASVGSEDTARRTGAHSDTGVADAHLDTAGPVHGRINRHPSPRSVVFHGIGHKIGKNTPDRVLIGPQLEFSPNFKLNGYVSTLRFGCKFTTHLIQEIDEAYGCRCLMSTTTVFIEDY